MQVLQQMQAQQVVGKSNQQQVAVVAAATAMAGCMRCDTPGSTEGVPAVAVAALLVVQQQQLGWTVMLTQH
jgi:hypothetical protein